MGYRHKKEHKPVRLFIDGNRINELSDLEQRKKLASARSKLEDLRMLKESGIDPSELTDELNTFCTSRQPREDLVNLRLI